MRPVVRGEWPKNSDGSNFVYKKYSDARYHLKNRLGRYCSYCGMPLDAGLGVEHVQPKKPAGILVKTRLLDWFNFLLACMNCNSQKGKEDVILSDYFWPDKDNTFLVIEYCFGGIVRPARSLTKPDSARALATIKLTGLDKTPLSGPGMTDYRCERRREIWDEAVMLKTDLESSIDPITMRRHIVLIAKAEGYWGVWMTVFKDDADMCKRLIDAFPGTSLASFDASNGYAPQIRPAGV